MNKWNLVIDIAKCEGCNNCLMACKDEHVGNDWPGYTQRQQLHGDHWIWVPKRERGEYPLIDVAYRPTPCQHCEDPACVRAFPDAIVRRADGIVLIDPVKAKGRKDLAAACPYDAIRWNEELDVAQKCTMCAHLLDDGWSKPRCVQACPTGALRFAKAGEPDVAAGAPPDELEMLHPEFNTKPSVRYANMYRYAKCFVAGSVSQRSDGIADCLKGASVHLYRGAVRIAEATTDGFGDFKFDGLDLGASGLSVKVKAAGFEDQGRALGDLSESICLDIVLQQSAAG